MTSDVSGRGVSISGAPVYTGVWANRPTATSFTGNTMMVTDIPIGGMSQWYSDGVNWRPLGGNITLAQAGNPVILLSSATTAASVTATGAITNLTALPRQYSGVCIVYMFALTGLTGSPGLFYATFSSTTSCQLYESVASNPAVPGTTTPSGISATTYAGGTSQATLVSVVIPGGSLALNGQIYVSQAAYSFPSNVNNKIADFLYGGASISSKTMPASSTVARYNRSFVNRYSTSVQVGHRDNTLGTPSETGSGSYNQIAIDSTVNQNFTLTGQLAVATDYLVLETYTVLLRG
jgi:hypothetical protein